MNMIKKVVNCFILLGIFIVPFNFVLAVDTNYRYTGQELDKNTDLYYYGQRYYNPRAGRFTQPDPVQNYLSNPEKLKELTGQELDQFLANPQNLNYYNYTRNNPVNAIDLLGLFTQVIIEKGEAGDPKEWVGHVLVNVNDEVIYGFAPTPGYSDDVQKFNKDQFEDNPDYQGSEFTTYTFDTMPEQEKIIADYYESLTFEANKQPGQEAPAFDLFAFNCTQVAQNALRAANVINWSGNLLTPHGLDKRLNEIYTTQNRPALALLKYGPIKYFILKDWAMEIIEKGKFKL